MRRSSIIALCLLSACLLEEQRYVLENKELAVTADTAPAYQDQNGNNFYVVEHTFDLPITRPSDQVLQMLGQRAQGQKLPFPRWPWVEQADVEYEVDYVLANLDNAPVVANVSLDGANEFFVYTPGQEDFHQWEQRIALGPKERKTGTISELEMDEVAIDLATVVNGAPNSNQIVQYQSQSGRDTRNKKYIPKVIPGLVRLVFGITMSGAAHNVVLEVSVRAQDHGDRVPSRGEPHWQLPAPMAFVPVVPEEDQ
jgi:hypothetical protein